MHLTIVRQDVVREGNKHLYGSSLRSFVPTGAYKNKDEKDPNDRRT
jgi:hypothetical protein